MRLPTGRFLLALPLAPVLAWITLVALTLPEVAVAAVIPVDTTADELNADGDCSLREALVAANSDAPVSGCPAGSGADTIELPAGTYFLTIAGFAEDAAATGDLDVNSDVTFVGTGSEPAIIDGSNILDRVIHMGPLVPGLTAYAVTFDNIVITGGNGGLLGAGLYIAGGTATTQIIDSRVEFNHSGLSGGGIYKSSGSLGTLEIFGSIVEGNTSVDRGAGLAIAGGGSTLIEDSLFRDNVDQGLGGNVAGGGAIHVGSSSPVTIRRSTFIGNETGENGGAIATTFGGGVIENSTFTLNTAAGVGGALSCGKPTIPSCGVQVRSSTFHLNTAANGGGIADPYSPGHVALRNSIVAGNDSIGTAPDLSGFWVSNGHNLIGNGDGATVQTPDATDLVGSGGSPIDPDLGLLTAYGDTTLGYPPNVQSPAFNSGLTPFSEDQRGEPRPAGPAADRGAIEAPFYSIALYLDFGADAGTPNDVFGAAAGSDGQWQTLGLGMTDELTSAYGYPTGVSVNVQSETDTDSEAVPGTVDRERLFNDSIRSCAGPATWSLDFAELPDGQYTLFFYAPADPLYPSGGIGVDGDVIAGIPGGTLFLIEDVSYQTRIANVSGGTLSLTGEFFFNCVGLAGVQLLPEPGFGAALVLGAFALTGLSAPRRDRDRGRS